MSIIRTKDHSKIINFIGAREGSGTSVATETGATIDHATLVTWDTNRVKLGNIGVNVALDSGSWQEPAASSDWALLLLINFNVTTFGTFTIGNDPANHRISFLSSAVPNITIEGTTDAAAFAGFGAPLNQVTRILITFDADDKTRAGVSATGVDVALTEERLSSVTGVVTTIDDVFSSNTSTGDIELYGLQMIEFTEGLPSDIVVKANAVFDLWEAENKSHYSLLEDE